MDEKNLEKYKRELDDLDRLSSKLDSLISDLRAEQLLVKNKVEELTTWKSGNAKDAFQQEMESYFDTFTKKIDNLEKAEKEVKHAKTKVKHLMMLEEMPTGPKW
ncbi:WXG100 family type VII secretion target [Priestia sp. YIM B13551]|uniref:WXG100 family type VII secretion target n=1 Tax=Priestia sp. YIM B13551 TaxID=3366306 RepID=UPI00366FEB34